MLSEYVTICWRHFAALGLQMAKTSEVSLCAGRDMLGPVHLDVPDCIALASGWAYIFLHDR